MPRLTDVFDRLTEALPGGDDDPLDAVADPFERLAAVLLATALEIELALRYVEVLRNAGLLDPEALASADPKELSDVARLGTKSVPARTLATLQRLARWARVRGVAEAGVSASTETLREELTAINGIGPGTADELLSRGLGRPAFAVSRAAYRILVRHGWIDASCTYEDARDLIESAAPDDSALLSRMSLGFEAIGAKYCRVSVAKCERCPLRTLLPEGGPVAPDG